MFTGLVEGTGRLRRFRPVHRGIRWWIEPELSPFELKVGDSVALDGVCLTVEALEGALFQVYLSPETLRVTKFHAGLPVGYRVNLERPLRAADRLGGHLVTGHVDTVGVLRGQKTLPEGQEWTVEVPPTYLRYLVPKGSVAVDGVSLTVNRVQGSRFTVFLIPHTLEVTNLGDRRPGDPLNLEFDLVAKYVESLLAPYARGLQTKE